VKVHVIFFLDKEPNINGARFFKLLKDFDGPL
jgi:hypothetical protein